MFVHIVLNGLHFFNRIFKCMLCPNAAPGLFKFLYMKCFLIGLHRVPIWWERLDVATFT